MKWFYCNRIDNRCNIPIIHYAHWNLFGALSKGVFNMKLVMSIISLIEQRRACTYQYRIRMAGLRLMRNLIIPNCRRRSVVAAAVNVCPCYSFNLYQSNTKMTPKVTVAIYHVNQQSLRLFAVTASPKKRKKRRYNGKKKPWQQKLSYESKLEQQKRMKNLHVSFITTHQYQTYLVLDISYASTHILILILFSLIYTACC